MGRRCWRTDCVARTRRLFLSFSHSRILLFRFWSRVQNPHGGSSAHREATTVGTERHGPTRLSLGPSKSQQLVAARDVPDLRRPVVAGRNEPSAVRTPGNVNNNIRVP